MKIAMLMSVYGEHAVGGAERTAAQVAEALAARGHELSLISLSSPHDSFHTTGQLVMPNVMSYRVPLSQSYDPYGLDGRPKKQKTPGALAKAWWHFRDVYNWVMTRRVKILLQKIKPDLLLTHTLQGFSVGVWDAAQSLGIRVMHMTHDHALICPATAMTKGSRVCEQVCTSCQSYSHLRHFVAAKPDAIVGPSQIILDRHRQFGWFRDVAQQFVIPNALSESWPQIDSASLAVLQDHSTIHFGFLGRVDESKGADVVIQAFAKLPRKFTRRWQMHFAGAGTLNQIQTWYEAGISDANAHLTWEEASQNIYFHGVVQASQFLQQIHVLIAPSRAHETFCNVVMEAAGLGRPSIVSNRGALPERVHNETTGWITPAGDVQALGLQIQNLIEEPHLIYPKALAALQTRPNYHPDLQAQRFEDSIKIVIEQGKL